jgi:ankyrin repeat protein
MVACVIGKIHTEVVESSLEQAEADRLPVDLTQALMRASLIGATAAVKTLLDAGADVNAADRHGRTALMEAVFSGHTETIRALLERGADVDAKDLGGWTALMEAASKGHTEIVRMLLARGADVNARNRGGWTASRAAARGNLELLMLLKRARSARGLRGPP